MRSERNHTEQNERHNFKEEKYIESACSIKMPGKCGLFKLFLHDQTATFCHKELESLRLVFNGSEEPTLAEAAIKN